MPPKKRTGEYSVTNIKAHYSDIKRKQDSIHCFYLRKVIRPLSFYLTGPFLHFGISANQVTILSLIFGVVGNIGLVIGSNFSLAFGILMFNISILFDFVDGNIARFWNKTNHFGKFLDGACGQLVYSLLPFCLGIGISRSIELVNFLGITASVALILGAATSILDLFTTMIRWRYRAAISGIQIEQIKNDDKINEVLIENSINLRYSPKTIITKILFYLYNKAVSINQVFSEMYHPSLVLIIVKLPDLVLVFLFLHYLLITVIIVPRIILIANRNLNIFRSF